MSFLDYCRNRGVPPKPKPEPEPKTKPEPEPKPKPKPKPKLEPVRTKSDPESDHEVDAKKDSMEEPPKPRKKAGRPPGAKTDRNRVGKIERELMMESIEKEIRDKLVCAESEGKLEKESNRIRTRLKLIRDVTSKHKKSVKASDDNIHSDTEVLGE